VPAPKVCICSVLLLSGILFISAEQFLKSISKMPVFSTPGAKSVRYNACRQKNLNKNPFCLRAGMYYNMSYRYLLIYGMTIKYT